MTPNDIYVDIVAGFTLAGLFCLGFMAAAFFCLLAFDMLRERRADRARQRLAAERLHQGRCIS